MISVCVPLYNHNAYPLVCALAQQAKALRNQTAEVVCINDGSSAQWQAVYSRIATVAKLITLPANVGRSKVRNLFLQHTQGQHLLFVDNDLAVPDGYLQRYADALNSSGAQAIVGGIVYGKAPKTNAYRLRYLYGKAAESNTAAQRSRHPYASIMTGNLLVSRSLLESNPFDETLTTYGHEDTLFGYSLQRSAATVLHIDNPCTVCDNETNAQFMQKTASAVDNLSKLYLRYGSGSDFCQMVRLATTYDTLTAHHLMPLVRAAWWLLQSPVTSHLMAGNGISIRMFNFYKLSLFDRNIKKYLSIEHNKTN